MSDWHEGKAIICNPKGLHMRAVRELVTLLKNFRAEVEIEHDGLTASGASPLDLLSLIAGEGCEVTVKARGLDAEAALAAVVDLVACGFHEVGHEVGPSA
jgi:phosphocarrier protein HPr